MRNLFALIGALIVGLGVLGWYLGWYKVNFSKNPEGNIQIQTDVDTKKVNGDSSAFFQKVGQIVDKTQQNDQNGTTSPANSPAANGSSPNTPLQGSAPTTSKGPMP
jgi:hypothetical protein